MKKIMFIAALAFGLAASGSTVNWSIAGNVSDSYAGGTAYLVWLGSGTSTPNAGGSYDPGDATTFSINNVIGSSDSVVDSVSVTSAGGVSGSAAWHNATGRQGFYVVIISSDATEMMIATSRKTATINADDAQNATLSWSVANMGSTISPSSSGDPTPEPTSGLLLLVGAGILGLRRKRA